MDSDSSSSSSIYDDRFWQLKTQYDQVLESNSQMVLRLEEARLMLSKNTTELQRQNSVVVSENMNLRAQKKYLLQTLEEFRFLTEHMTEEMELQETCVKRQKAYLVQLASKVNSMAKNTNSDLEDPDDTTEVASFLNQAALHELDRHLKASGSNNLSTIEEEKFGSEHGKNEKCEAPSQHPEAAHEVKTHQGDVDRTVLRIQEVVDRSSENNRSMARDVTNATFHHPPANIEAAHDVKTRPQGEVDKTVLRIQEVVEQSSKNNRSMARDVTNATFHHPPANIEAAHDVKPQPQGEVDKTVGIQEVFEQTSKNKRKMARDMTNATFHLSPANNEASHEVKTRSQGEEGTSVLRLQEVFEQSSKNNRTMTRDVTNATIHHPPANDEAAHVHKVKTQPLGEEDKTVRIQEIVEQTSKNNRKKARDVADATFYHPPANNEAEHNVEIRPGNTKLENVVFQNRQYDGTGKNCGNLGSSCFVDKCPDKENHKSSDYDISLRQNIHSNKDETVRTQEFVEQTNKTNKTMARVATNATYHHPPAKCNIESGLGVKTGPQGNTKLEDMVFNNRHYNGQSYDAPPKVGAGVKCLNLGYFFDTNPDGLQKEKQNRSDGITLRQDIHSNKEVNRTVRIHEIVEQTNKNDPTIARDLSFAVGVKTRVNIQPDLGSNTIVDNISVLSNGTNGVQTLNQMNEEQSGKVGFSEWQGQTKDSIRGRTSKNTVPVGAESNNITRDGSQGRVTQNQETQPSNAPKTAESPKPTQWNKQRESDSQDGVLPALATKWKNLRNTFTFDDSDDNKYKTDETVGRLTAPSSLPTGDLELLSYQLVKLPLSDQHVVSDKSDTVSYKPKPRNALKRELANLLMGGAVLLDVDGSEPHQTGWRTRARSKPRGNQMEANLSSKSIPNDANGDLELKTPHKRPSRRAKKVALYGFDF